MRKIWVWFQYIIIIYDQLFTIYLYHQLLDLLKSFYNFIEYEISDSISYLIPLADHMHILQYTSFLIR